MRFGLLGTGPWAQLAHAPALASHEHVDLIGIWGRDPVKAGDLASRSGVTAYPDVDALIADVDAVAIALPPDVQAPLAVRAARAGRHLLLDKPVAFTVAAAREIVTAVEDRDLASVVFFTRRFAPDVAAFLADAEHRGGWLEARVDHVGTIYDDDNPFGASPWRRASGGLWGRRAARHRPGPAGARTRQRGHCDGSGPATCRTCCCGTSTARSAPSPCRSTCRPRPAREEAIFAGETGIAAVPQTDWDPLAAYAVALDHLLAAAAGGPRSSMDVAFGARGHRRSGGRGRVGPHRADRRRHRRIGAAAKVTSSSRHANASAARARANPGGRDRGTSPVTCASCAANSVGWGPTPAAVRCRADLLVVQVGDLVHRGPDSAGVVALVERYLNEQPDQWIQLVGNHEAQYLAEPRFAWPERLDPTTVGSLRRWWSSGQLVVAVALSTPQENFLLTHAGPHGRVLARRLGPARHRRPGGGGVETH